MCKKNIILCGDAAHATILAALRLYQREGMGEPDNRSDELHDISTNGDRVTSSLDDQGIDELCEELNVGNVDMNEALIALKERGLDFGSCVNAFGVSSDEDPFAKAADENFHSEGDIEIDGTTVVSRGDDMEGAYVLAWKWVSAEDAGIYSPSVHFEHFLAGVFGAIRKLPAGAEALYNHQVYSDYLEKIVGNHEDQIDEIDFDVDDPTRNAEPVVPASYETDDGRVIEVSPEIAVNSLIKLVRGCGVYDSDTSLALEFLEEHKPKILALLGSLSQK